MDRTTNASTRSSRRHDGLRLDPRAASPLPEGEGTSGSVVGAVVVVTAATMECERLVETAGTPC